MAKIVLRQKPTASAVLVDFPRQDEKVTSTQYTIRVGAPETAKNVEVCVDQGDWRQCRRASGYWWHDWSSYGDGEHEVIARADVGNDRQDLSQATEFFVKLSQPES